MLTRSGTQRDNWANLLFSLPATLTKGSLLPNKGLRTELIKSHNLSEPEESISDSQGDKGGGWRRCCLKLHVFRMLCFSAHYLILGHDGCPVSCAISFSVLENKREKMSKRDYMEIWNLFNAWLFAYIWPRPVSCKLPRIFNGSQGNPSFDFITLAFLNHFNCSN